MDPDANLREQEAVLLSIERLNASEPDQFTNHTRRALLEELIEYRQALYDWIRDGGFEPDWSKAPNARGYYGR